MIRRQTLIRHLVIDCRAELIRVIMDQASQIGLVNEYHSFMFTSLVRAQWVSRHSLGSQPNAIDFGQKVRSQITSETKCRNDTGEMAFENFRRDTLTPCFNKILR